MSLDKYKQDLEAFLANLDAFLNKYPTVANTCATYKIRSSYVGLAVAGLFLAFSLFGFGQAAVCNAIGFFYPLFQSFKALRTDNKQDDTQWLTYWMVYGSFTLVESFTDVLFRWIPFYYLFKVLGLVWLYLPSTRGATVVFSTLIQPFLKKHESQIDSGLRRASQFVGQVHGAQQRAENENKSKML